MEAAGKLKKYAGWAIIGGIIVFFLYLSYRETGSLTDCIEEALLLGVLYIPYALTAKYFKDIHLDIVMFTLSMIAFKLLTNHFIFFKSPHDSGVAYSAGYAAVQLFRQKKPLSKMAILKTAGIILLFLALFFIGFNNNIDL